MRAPTSMKATKESLNDRGVITVVIGAHTSVLRVCTLTVSSVDIRSQTSAALGTTLAIRAEVYNPIRKYWQRETRCLRPGRG